MMYDLIKNMICRGPCVLIQELTYYNSFLFIFIGYLQTFHKVVLDSCDFVIVQSEIIEYSCFPPLVEYNLYINLYI